MGGTHDALPLPGLWQYHLLREPELRPLRPQAPNSTRINERDCYLHPAKKNLRLGTNRVHMAQGRALLELRIEPRP
jgi:hypothetical protein